MKEILDWSQYHHIVILTGAGISVASGLQPFRGPGGVWNELDMDRYGSIEGFRHDPLAVWQRFGPMRDRLKTAAPNAAHRSLAEMQTLLQQHQTLTLITQNIDGLHQRAGSQDVVEMHGSIHYTRCLNESCDLEPYWDEDSHDRVVPSCPRCGVSLRPDIVFFGEMIPLAAMEIAEEALSVCDLFIAVGTSGVVFPAAEFVRSAYFAGARTILVNLEPMIPPNPYFREEILGKAEETLPELLGIS